LKVLKECEGNRTRKDQDLCFVCVPAPLKIIIVSQRNPAGIATLPASRSLGTSCSSSAPALPTPNSPPAQPIIFDKTTTPRDVNALSLQNLLGALRRYGLIRRALCAARFPRRYASMAEEPRQRRPLSRHGSQDVLPEPEPAHTRQPDEESASDNEREATELRSITPGQHSARRRSRVLSPPASSKLHWYDPVSKYWRHHINITVPHDDCRDHLGKARTLCCACARCGWHTVCLFAAFFASSTPLTSLTIASK
jgi:hypothetical protein